MDGPRNTDLLNWYISMLLSCGVTYQSCKYCLSTKRPLSYSARKGFYHMVQAVICSYKL